MRKIKVDFLPSLRNHGVHVIVDSSKNLVRNILDPDQEIEELSLSTLNKMDHFERTKFAQEKRSLNKSVVIFLDLDDDTAGRISGSIPPRSTPSRTLKECIPTCLFEVSDTVCYATKDMVLVIQSRRIPEDVYFLNGQEDTN